VPKSIATIAFFIGTEVPSPYMETNTMKTKGQPQGIAPTAL